MCATEVEGLRRRDAGGKLRLVDISAPAFDASPYGRTLDELMARMHAIDAEGRTLVGMDAVRAAYGAVGLGWLVAPTRWPGVRPLFDRLYDWIARNRYRLDVLEFYNATDADYGQWSADFNMHFGYWARGMNPLAREAMLERMNREVVGRLRLQDEGVVADLGCGTGATARSLVRQHPRARVSAVTIVPAQISRGRRLSAGTESIDFVLADYTATELASAAFDGAYAVESWCHARGAGKRAAVAEAARLLKPGGRLVVADCFVKSNRLPWWIRGAYRAWCRSWAITEMAEVGAVRGALEEAGFTDIEFQDISWRVAPSIAHVPYVATRFLVTELLQGKLTKWRRRHVLASVLSIMLGMCRGSFGYYLVSARKHT
jgi:predicted DCC family thiol-disulfide oxidoreductase YuxK/ubiquinone/menaquinone biosynthesis C-methylase UbiE